MIPNDFAQLEKIEFDAYVDFFRAVPDEVRKAHAVEVRTTAAATCLTSHGIEPATIFRRAIGIGVSGAVSEQELDDVLAQMSAQGPRYAIPVAEYAQPSSLASWLEARGFTRGYAWMKFRRTCEAVARPESDLEILVADRALGAEFGRVVVEGFGMSPVLVPWIAALPARPNWVCVMAFANGIPIAAGAVYINGDYAWLGFGATLASHRRHGAQNALLARRLSEAAARAARVAVTETGERVTDKPSNSYRNILRAGFAEMYLRQNCMSP